jgi:ABC-2 type transport system ATP-binding protein
MSDNWAVEICQAQKSYGALQALKGIDLRIPRGSFFGLLGPNGAGKSTLISAMAGLTRLTAGEIRICGADVVKDYRQSRRSLGVVPQELVNDHFFSIRDLMRLQAGYFGFGREKNAWIDELLEIMNLTEKAHKQMGQLSGGMKRRVLIAMALVHDPEVLVLDEPTAGVDVELRHLMWKFVRELHARGKTIILTTHYLEEAEALCDQIAIIDKGQLLTCTTKEELMKQSGDKRLEQVFLEMVAQSKKKGDA